MIIALGESIVAIGVGVGDAADHLADPRRLARSGCLLASAMWWAYFDVSALSPSGPWPPSRSRPRRLGRDGVHLRPPAVIAAIVVTALGLKKVLEYVGETDHHELPTR